MGIETTLIGRERELSGIEGLLAAVDSGGWQVLAISGEPGIGKTRLLSELGSRAAARAYTVLSGRGTELEREVPFAALVEALDDFLGSLGPRRLQALGARLPHLAGVFPAVGGLVAAQTGLAAERYRHHRAIRALVEQLAAARPLVLVLDDVHWADPASVEAIAHLLRRPPVAPGLLALSFRTGQASPILAGALKAAARDTRTDELVLGTLSEEQAATLLASEPEAERRRIFLESGGNPFYIEQLLRAPRSLEALNRAAAAVDGTVRIPAAVVAAIEEELRQLPTYARRMLEGAAVAGEPFEPELAAETAGLEPERALALLDELVARDCVRAEPAPRRFRFRHPIVRRAVYDAIPPGRRLAAHRHAAAALGQLGAPAIAGAHHIALSARPGDDAAIASLTDAAVQVAGRAPASAAHWFAVALSLLGAAQVQRRLSVLAPLAEAQAAAGRLADARDTLVKMIAELGADSRVGLSDAVATLASVELHLGRHSGARRRLEAALAAIGDRSSPQAIPLLLALALDLAYQGDWKPGVEVSATALAAAATAGDPPVLAAARSVLTVMLEGAGEIDASIDRCRVAAAELDALSDDQVSRRLDVAYHLGTAESFLERFDDAARHLERGVQIALACGNGQFIVPTRTFLAYTLLHLGRLDDALRVADEAVETGRLLRVPAGTAWALAVTAAAWSAIDPRHALRLGQEALDVLRDVDDNVIADATHAHFACVCADAGEHERCIEHMHQAGAPRFERFEPGRRYFFAEALVRSTLATSRLDEARAWAARGEEFAADLDLPVAGAAVQRARALVQLADGNADAAADLALQAADAAAGRGARIEAARSRILAARALATTGSRDLSIKELRAAHADLARCGARRLAHQAAHELRALGAPTPAPVARRAGDIGTTELSTREREVATLVAAGHSNREIAAALYLSPKTIEGNMRRIFEKLGVTSRAQLAATIARAEPSNQSPPRA